MKEKENTHFSKNLFSEMEKGVLSYWDEKEIFEKTLQKTKKGKPFIFYEGPPYANGRPGIHHVLARSFKDIILRFKTMQGYFVPRKAGWDTHGLPTEMEVEKKLNVHTKKEIEALGVDTFVETARENVFEYKHEWEKMTMRMGYWLDLERPYVTMTNEYIQGLWWVFSRIAKNGYLYKDYKVLPWCPRCETSLSSHEVAQGYQKIKDSSLYVKFQIPNFKSNSKLKISNDKPTYLLAWTTTPWTLPGNVALAVNPKATYVTVEKDGEHIILAEECLSVLGEGWKIVKKKRGKDMAGMKYEPLYRIRNQESRIKDLKVYEVIDADFVTTEDGTGIVHIAPAFGADDQKAGKKHNLPMRVTVGEDGKMKTPGYIWDGKLFEEANMLILKDLAARTLLFKKESYEHDYPFCWRCQSKLIYYAKDSWFLKTTAIKQRMIVENKKIGWHPEFVGKSRFGEWLRENVDWAISRERFWGMPLSIWKCGSCAHTHIVGSLAELDTYAPKDKTEIYLMRHGEANHNVKGIVGPADRKHDRHNALTQKGEKDVKETTQKFKKAPFDMILSSPLNRARQTAKIVSKELGSIPIETRDDLADINVGAWHGKTIEEVDTLLPPEKRFENAFPEGESVRDTRARIMTAFQDIRRAHKGKKILIVSHGDPLWLLHAALQGAREEDYGGMWYPEKSEIKRLTLHNWPYSKKRGELDFHRPYIDEIIIICPKCKKGEMRRIKDVADVWFDSGAMPYAQGAISNFPAFAKASTGKQFPISKKVQNFNLKNIQRYIPFPADYICEGMDQTRGWFYTLLAVSSLLRLPAPYKNVITTGLVLDAKGEKMSKSRGNTVDPFLLFETHGADAVRWYFYTINHPWDEKLFNERDVQDASRRFLMIFWNIFQYWKGFETIFNFQFSISKKIQNSKFKIQDSKLVINRWLLARLDEVTMETTKALDEYDVVRAARLLEYFITEDVSRWYIRRIRQTMKLGDISEQKETHTVLSVVLAQSATLLAPFIPFLAEKIYQSIVEKGESVHVAEWPVIRSQKSKVPEASRFSRSNGAGKSQKLLEDMNRAREIVARALQLRSEAKIKVRQPLAELRVKNQELGIKGNKELQELIKGEVNVKKIIFGAKIKNELELDTVLTPELKKEGTFRDLVRHIQQMRKDANLTPQEKITLDIAAGSEGQEVVKKFLAQLKKEVNAKEIIVGEATHSLFMKTSLTIEDYYFEIGFRK